MKHFMLYPARAATKGRQPNSDKTSDVQRIMAASESLRRVRLVTKPNPHTSFHKVVLENELKKDTPPPWSHVLRPV